MIMQDYAYKDSRSIAAMLSGRGDKREQYWLEFEKLYPELTQDVLMSQYSKEIRYGRIKLNSFVFRVFEFYAK